MLVGQISNSSNYYNIYFSLRNCNDMVLLEYTYIQ